MSTSAAFPTHSNGYLSADEKADLVTAGTPFHITAVRKEHSRFGERFLYSLIVEQQQRVLTLAPNPAREREAVELGQLLQQHEAVGPVVLAQVPTRKGKLAYVFRPTAAA